MRSIVATARSPQTRKRVAELGVVDQVVESNAAAAAGADLVIVCIPVGACGEVAREIGPHLMKGATVSDVGSVKGSVMRDMAPHLPAGVHFVPAHPVAGTEHSGPDSGFAELFVNRWCILTPPPNADQARSSGSPLSGASSAPTSNPCRPTTTTSCSASPATCRT